MRACGCRGAGGAARAQWARHTNTNNPPSFPPTINTQQQEGLTGKLAYEPRRGNVVAAVFDDGENGPLWYVGVVM